MNHLGSRVRLLLLLLPISTGGCSESLSPPASKIPQVYTTFYPTTYFAQRIGGDRVRVICPLPAEEDPTDWMPKAATIQAFQQADLIIVNGANFERWLGKVSLPESKLVVSARPLENQWIKYENVVTHSHGKSTEHSHEGIDGHTWLDPNNAKIQAEEIRKAIVTMLPEFEQEFQANYDALAADLDDLDQALKALSKTLGKTHLFTSHPAYNYLARRYEWQITHLNLDPDVMPDDETFAQIRQKLNKKPTRVLLWERQPRKEIAERFASELKLTSVEFSPCETSRAGNNELDYLGVMKANLERFRAALSEQTRVAP